MADKKEKVKVEEEVVEEVEEEVVEEVVDNTMNEQSVGRIYTDGDGDYIWRLRSGMDAPAKVYLD